MLFQNDSQTVSEVTAAFEAYERALLSNDVPTLQNFFWKSPLSVRFGVTEQLYGHEEISAFRQTRIPNFTSREQLKLAITTFGDSFASVMYEYISNYDDGARQGRQSQTWIKIDGQWKIVSAHVSHAVDSQDSLKQRLSELGLTPESENMPTIKTHFQTTSELAEKLMTYPLLAHIEPAPVFNP